MRIPVLVSSEIQQSYSQCRRIAHHFAHNTERSGHDKVANFESEVWTLGFVRRYSRQNSHGGVRYGALRIVERLRTEAGGREHFSRIYAEAPQNAGHKSKNSYTLDVLRPNNLLLVVTHSAFKKSAFQNNSPRKVIWPD